jgi:large subunit ribosomal protein L5
MSDYICIFEDYYEKEGKALLQKALGYTNPMQLPRLEKVVVNMSTKDIVQNSKLIDNVVEELFLITGQKPVITRSKKAIAAFKLREDVVIGAKVTLRGKRMYDFLYKLIYIALPGSRDFKGFSSRKQFDRTGNFSLGIKEQVVFPEINYDKVDKIRGMDITIVTTAKTDEEAKELLTIFKFPFRW